MAKRKSGIRKFGRDVSVIVAAGVVSGIIALALYARRKQTADSTYDLPSPEELRQRLITYGPEEWGLTPGPRVMPIAMGPELGEGLFPLPRTPGEALIDEVLFMRMEAF